MAHRTAGGLPTNPGLHSHEKPPSWLTQIDWEPQLWLWMKHSSVSKKYDVSTGGSRLECRIRHGFWITSYDVMTSQNISEIFTWASIAADSSISFISSAAWAFITSVGVVASGISRTIVRSDSTFINIGFTVRSGPSISTDAEWGTTTVKFATTVRWATTIVFATWIIH